MATGAAGAQAAWPGANGLLAVTEADGKDFVVSLIGPDGAKSVLVDSEAADGGPTFDPGGQRIAYSRITLDDTGRPTAQQVRIRALDDPASDRVVYEPAPDKRLSGLEWARDGQHLQIGLIDTDTGAGSVIMVDLDGAFPVVILDDVRSFANGPGGVFGVRLTDEGRRIVSANQTGTSGDVLDIQPPFGSGLTLLDASPDGASIAYVHFDSARECGELRQVARTGGQSSLVGDPWCDALVRSTAYSPDGTRAAVSTHATDAPGLVLADLATGARTPLAGGDFATVDWQPRPRLATTLGADPAIASIAAPGTSVNLKLSAVLRSGTTALAGRSLTFSTPAGSTLCIATTDATGRASCSAVAPLVNATLSLGYRVEYLGEIGYLPATASGGIVKVGSLSLRLR